jgi:hypothetical protein
MLPASGAQVTKDVMCQCVADYCWTAGCPVLANCNSQVGAAFASNTCSTGCLLQVLLLLPPPLLLLLLLLQC